MNSNKQVERYSIERSPFYRMGRSRDLAQLLRITPQTMTSLIVRRSALYIFRQEEVCGKKRSLAIPINEMRAVHERIKDLFGRIVLPDYLYSPKRGRTAMDNALAHVGSPEFVKVDIKQFYPSTTPENVFQFLHHRLGMADDVAGRLTKLCTINDRVPFGSPLSPILCALVHDDLFGRVAQRCALEEDTLTLWVDDLAMSGNHVRAGLVQDIKRLIRAKGLIPHKAKRSTARQGIVITGIYLGRHGPAPANKSHLRMREKLEALKVESDPAQKHKLLESLIGMANHQLRVFPAGSEPHQRALKRKQWFWWEIRNLTSSGFMTGAMDKVDTKISDQPPWEELSSTANAATA